MYFVYGINKGNVKILGNLYFTGKLVAFCSKKVKHTCPEMIVFKFTIST